jgi:hypothetical protein
MSYMPNAYQYEAYKREAARNTPEALTKLLDSGALQGTLARHKYNGGLYWSSGLYPHGIPDNLDGWLYLGYSGYYHSEARKVLYNRVRDMAGDMIPQYGGEYSEFGPQLTLDI